MTTTSSGFELHGDKNLLLLRPLRRLLPPATLGPINEAPLASVVNTASLSLQILLYCNVRWVLLYLTILLYFFYQQVSGDGMRGGVCIQGADGN